MSSKGKYAPPSAQKEAGVIEDEEGVEQRDFVVSKGLTSQEAASLLESWGRNELQEKSKANVINCTAYFTCICKFDFFLTLNIFSTLFYSSGLSSWSNSRSPCPS